MTKARFVIAGTVLCAALFPVAADAASINYGDFAGGSVMYLDVTESSATDPVPLFGEPNLAANSLVFDPINFESFSLPGSADITDGQLDTTLMAIGQDGEIDSVWISEQGDYTLTGFGDASARVALRAFVRIDEVDGVGVSGLSAILPVIYESSADGITFSADDGVFSLADGDLGGFWRARAHFDVDAFLEANQIDGSATKVHLTFDNTLVTLADDSSIALIEKKEFIIDTEASAVPEPATAGLALLGLLGIGACRRRRK